MPKTHSSHFENILKPGVDDLGQVLHQVVSKLELALDSPAYNYIIHTAPFDHGELPHYHWHIEVIPRLTKVAGFEWGSGFYINPVPPENAARFLREVDVAGSDPRPGLFERGRGEPEALARSFVGWAPPTVALCCVRDRRQSQGSTMSQVRLILALHNHQPVGNFDGVFEEAYRTSYRPFLDVLENYPEIPFALHTSGPLLEWLVDKHPEYIARLRALVESGRVEILGGGFFEPILTMIPERDRIGQIQAFSSYLHELFGARVRGMWVAERVWEQHLVRAIVDAGIEYTVLDDFHFERAGCSEDDVFGYHLTEDDGRLLKIFPAAEKLRYSIPFQEPHETYKFLKELAARRPGSTVVFADDGEKFGSWPKTFDHVYTNGWLNHFCDMLRANRDWIETTTFARAVDSSLPLGKVFLPDSSYREMTEWALPPESLRAFRRGAERLGSLPDAGEIKRFFRAGGYWRNFKARYPESDEMYARMLGVSRRLEAVERNPDADPDYLEIARQELYRGQCNCPYWHGTFGGLYLPHLRNAIYRGLITAHNALDDAEGRTGPAS